MTAGRATCLRCDWVGEGRAGSACPSCGAPVFAARPPATDPVTEASGRQISPLVEITGGNEGSEPPAPARWRGPVILVMTILIGAGSFLVIADHSTPGAGRAPDPGSLIYTAEVSSSTSQLFRWDLSTGVVAPGPKIERLESLTKVGPERQDWIGVTTRLASGRMQVSLLRSLSPDAVPSALLKGELVAFDAVGVSAAAVTESPSRRPCRHRISILVREISVNVRDRQYSADSCAHVLFLARASGTTYLTLERNGSPEVDFVGSGVLHQVLADYQLVSISSAGDMLVVPPSSVAAWLYFRGTGALDPIPFSDGQQPFDLGYLLAWSPDASEGLVVGRLGLQVGIFRITVGPGASPRLPTFVSAVPDRAWGCYAADGTALVSTGGKIYRIRGEQVEPLALPVGAPIPTGPVAWVP